MDPKENQELNNLIEIEAMSQLPIPVLTGKNSASIAHNVWGIQAISVPSTELHVKKIQMTHGMFANVPILCKDSKCPYIDACEIPVNQRVLGQRCPQEAAIIMARYEAYCDHFGISLSNVMISAVDIVDAGLIKDLVDIEVQIFRTENRTAIRGDFLELKINTVERGKAWYEKAVSPESEYKNTLLEKKFKILNLLNSTRKDKAAMAKLNDNPSIKAVSIFKKINETLSGQQTKIEIYDVEEAIIIEHEGGK